MNLRTSRRFTRRNWTADRLKIAAAPKGQKTAAQADLVAIVKTQLAAEVALRKARAA